MKIIIDITNKSLDEITKEIVYILWKFNGENSGHTAKVLGIAHRTMRIWTKRWGFERSELPKQVREFRAQTEGWKSWGSKVETNTKGE